MWPNIFDCIKQQQWNAYDSLLADFYQPLQEDELEQSTVVPILYEMDLKPVRFNVLRELWLYLCIAEVEES